MWAGFDSIWFGAVRGCGITAGGRLDLDLRCTVQNFQREKKVNQDRTPHDSGQLAWGTWGTGKGAVELNGSATYMQRGNLQTTRGHLQIFVFWGGSASFVKGMRTNQHC